ncbi:MAG: CocE/NonD family hydrolase [Anaerolineales bacterium]|nr:CocE/NonD family hydrolase [Anaerolineales bacterium]
MKNFIADDKQTRSLLYFVVILALLGSCAGLASTNSPLPSETTIPMAMISAPTATATGLPADAPEERLSQPGEYAGYSQPLYGQRTSTSQYIPMRDGTKLAALILRPAQDGETVSTPLPVVWTHNRYHREGIFNWHHLQPLLKHGYIIVSVDVRGTGASFGTYRGLFTPEETRDAYDITEWLAVQPWSDGNIGMFGRSYLGITQFMAASTAPPHLKAIFPEMSEFDHYSFVYPGGVFHDDFFRRWGNMIKKLDADGSAVDEDRDKAAMLQAALKEHAANVDVFEMYSSLPYRDSVFALTGTQPYIVDNPAHYLKEIGNSGVPVYHWAGWNDMFPKDALLWYSNLTNPQKITIGPWAHPQLGSLDLATELVRWYDYWLKGIDNGVMDEAPIYYYTLGEGKKTGWHPAWQWPLPEQQLTNYYFDGTKTGSVDSVNDGSLSLVMPETTAGVDEYQVDYSTTSGTATRWTAEYDMMSPIYPNTMMFNDQKGLTYTTPPLTAEVEVTGHPVVHLWVTSSARDGDFFVYLEDISAAKYSKYVTQGNLRASHRAISTPPYEYLGLPYHRSDAEDIADLPGQPVELVFDLLPTSYVFEAGHRIRVTITCADKDTALTPQLDPPPTVHLYREADHASYIVLPIIPNP